MNDKKKRMNSKTAVTPKKSNNSDALGEVTFHFVKSPQHRVIRVNGAVGGVSPQNEVMATLYVERPPIPESITHNVLPVGLDSNIKRQTVKKGIVREAEVTLSLDPMIAKSLALWLLKQVEKSEEFKEEYEQAKSKFIKEEV